MKKLLERIIWQSNYNNYFKIDCHSQSNNNHLISDLIIFKFQLIHSIYLWCCRRTPPLDPSRADLIIVKHSEDQPDHERWLSGLPGSTGLRGRVQRRPMVVSDSLFSVFLCEDSLFAFRRFKVQICFFTYPYKIGDIFIKFSFVCCCCGWSLSVFLLCTFC